MRWLKKNRIAVGAVLSLWIGLTLWGELSTKGHFEVGYFITVPLVAAYALLPMAAFLIVGSHLSHKAKFSWTSYTLKGLLIIFLVGCVLSFLIFPAHYNGKTPIGDFISNYHIPQLGFLVPTVLTTLAYGMYLRFGLRKKR